MQLHDRALAQHAQGLGLVLSTAEQRNSASLGLSAATLGFLSDTVHFRKQLFVLVQGPHLGDRESVCFSVLCPSIRRHGFGEIKA